MAMETIELRCPSIIYILTIETFFHGTGTRTASTKKKNQELKHLVRILNLNRFRNH